MYERVIFKIWWKYLPLLRWGISWFIIYFNCGCLQIFSVLKQILNNQQEIKLTYYRFWKKIRVNFLIILILGTTDTCFFETVRCGTLTIIIVKKLPKVSPACLMHHVKLISSHWTEAGQLASIFHLCCPPPANCATELPSEMGGGGQFQTGEKTVSKKIIITLGEKTF